MKITENKTIPDYDTGYIYRMTIVTDSSIERDIIQKHLAHAQGEYSSQLRGQTKPLPEAKVAYAARVDTDHDFKQSKEKYSSIFCKCDMLIFFEAPLTGWYKVKCPNPNCGYCQNVLVNKGEINNG